MNQKKLSGVLILAGAMAALGMAFLFYIVPAYLQLRGRNALYSLTHMAIGVPYMIALWNYFRICQNIGRDRSFCRENALRMDRIAMLLFLASGLWTVLLVAILLLSRDAGSDYTAIILVEDGLALVATLAVALVAKMMALLVSRANHLQEENDLTI